MFLEFKTEVIGEHTAHKWTDERIRKPKPSWGDLKENRICIPREVFETLLQCLRRESLAILAGSKDAGKTWLCYLLGYHCAMEEQADVLFCQIDEAFLAVDAFNYLFKQGVLNSRFVKTLVILDDCHLNPDEIEEFLDRIIGIDCANVKFLFSTRRSGTYILRDVEHDDTLHYVGKEKDCVVNLSNRHDGGKYVRDICNMFVRTCGMSHEITDDELCHLVSICGEDLYFLRLLLNSWKCSGVSVLELTKKHVYDSLWAADGDFGLVDTSKRKVLSTVSHFSQFEPLMVSREYLQSVCDYSTVQAFRRRGLFDAKTLKGADFFGLSDTLSDLILETVEFKRGTSGALPETTGEVFRSYLSVHPANWLWLFTSLQFACKCEKSSKSHIAQKIIAELCGNRTTVTCLGDILGSARPIEVEYLLRVLKSQNVSDATISDLWARFKQRSDASLTTAQLLTQTRTLSTAWSFLQVAKTIDRRYVEEILQRMSAYPKRLVALMNKSTVPTQIHFLLKFAQKNKSLLNALLGKHDILADIRQRNRRRTATQIRIVVGLAKSAGADVEELFAGYDASDWNKIIAKSTMNGIRLLVYCLHRFHVTRIAYAFCQALCTCDLARLIARNDTTIYRLNGLIGNIRQVDAEIAGIFVDSLACVPMGDLFLRKTSYFDREGKSKASQINMLLFMTDEFRPGFLKRVVGQVAPRDWKQLIEEAPTEDGLWLVWAIYRGDDAICKEVVDSELALRLDSGLMQSQLGLKLPMVGVLLLCGLEVGRVLWAAQECHAVVGEMVKNNQYSRLVLSLISLQATLNEHEYAAIVSALKPDLAETLLHSGDHEECFIGRIIREMQLL